MLLAHRTLQGTHHGFVEVLAHLQLIELVRLMTDMNRLQLRQVHQHLKLLQVGKSHIQPQRFGRIDDRSNPRRIDRPNRQNIGLEAAQMRQRQAMDRTSVLQQGVNRHNLQGRRSLDPRQIFEGRDATHLKLFEAGRQLPEGRKRARRELQVGQRLAPHRRQLFELRTVGEPRTLEGGQCAQGTDILQSLAVGDAYVSQGFQGRQCVQVSHTRGVNRQQLDLGGRLDALQTHQGWHLLEVQRRGGIGESRQAPQGGQRRTPLEAEDAVAGRVQRVAGQALQRAQARTALQIDRYQFTACR